jgi:hypothetical protein
MLRGTTSAIPVRRPTDAEFANFELERFKLMYETPDWDHNYDSRERAETQLSSKLLSLEECHVHSLQIQDHDAVAISSATHARLAWAHQQVDPSIGGGYGSQLSCIIGFRL